MNTAPVAERLIAARSDVKRACDLLLAPTPEALNECEHALQRATTTLQQSKLQGSEAAESKQLRSTACELHAEVRRATRLLEGVSTFYLGWERILGALSGGYTAQGDPAPVERGGHLCYRG